MILDAVDPWQVLFSEAQLDALKQGRGFEDWLRLIAERMHPGADAEFFAASNREARVRAIAETALAAGQIGVGELPEDPLTIERFLHVLYQNTVLLLERPASEMISCPTLVVRASDTRARMRDPALGWSAVCGSIETFDVAFRHLDLMHPDAVAVIADRVRKWILASGNRVDRSGPGRGGAIR